MGLFDFFNRKSSSEVAKDRLKLLLVSDRVNCSPEVMEMIRQGKVDGSIVASFYEYGYRSVEMLYAYITEGKKPEERVQDVVMIMVTKENIDTYQKELSA